MNTRSTVIIAAVLALAACTGNRDTDNARKAATEENLRMHTEAVSHDSCQGRKPFSAGADRAVGYIAGQMKAIGLEPFDGDSFLQPVSIKAAQFECPGPMVMQTSEGRISLEWQEDYVAFSACNESRIDIRGSELVFAGYGISAPEYGKMISRGSPIRRRRLR